MGECAKFRDDWTMLRCTGFCLHTVISVYHSQTNQQVPALLLAVFIILHPILGAGNKPETIEGGDFHYYLY